MTDLKKFIVRDLHTLKIVKKFNSYEHARDFAKDISKRKKEGEILNSVYVAQK